MEPERFQRVKTVFDAAMQRAAGERESFVEKACRGDESVAAEVRKLLAAHEKAGSFLEKPALDAEETQTIHEPYLGFTLGERYHIAKPLGRGGFGVVYLAHDTHVHNKPVVVKILRNQIERSDWCEKKFQKECEALARINHPGVVGVLDRGEAPDGLPYLVLEYVDGKTLRSAMPAQGMELPRVAALVRQLGQALDAAHDHGVFHRDLKPENVMLRELGEGQEFPVIIDFGVATVKDPNCAGNTATRIAGSYPYMAPEQLAGHPEAASDTYALGVIAYEMITGKRPFNEESPIGLFRKQEQGLEKDPSELRPGVSGAADEAVRKALAYDPKSRYARASDFGRELSLALTSGLPQRRLPRVRALVTRRRAAGLAAVGGALGAVFGGRRWLKPAAVPPTLPERTLSYFIVVQRFRGGKPLLEPFRLAGEMLFPAHYGIRLVFTSPQPGYLYLINEAPETQEALPSYNILFPSQTTNQSSAFLAPDREVTVPAGNEYLVFDEQQGEEKIWMVWAGNAVAGLEAAKRWANPRDKGTVKDRREILAIKELLAGHFASKPQVERSEAGKSTLVRGRGDVLVHLLKLEHR